MGIPFLNEGQESLGWLIEARKVTDTESLVLENAEPLLDLVHPRAMHRRKVTAEAGMSGQPSLNLTT